MTPSQLEQLPEELRKMVSELEIDIMLDIVRRIKINGEITRAADWQLYRMSELGNSSEWLKERLQSFLEVADEEIERMYEVAAKEDYIRDEFLYEATGKPFIPYEENQELKQLVSAIQEQTKGDLYNITQSMGFAIKVDSQIVFKPIAEYYQQTLDDATLKISTGTFDYNTTIKTAIKEMTASGIKTVDYATGHRNSIIVATRRAVTTGIAQVTEKIVDSNAEQLETDYFEVSWHGTARPTHVIWQGRVYSRAELISICGLGTVTGLHGANCYHDYHPFIKGISVRLYTDAELDKMNADEQEKMTFDIAGKQKEYDRYEASQQQRKLETLMRKQRREIKLLKEGEVEQKDITAARARYRGTMQQYVRFSKEMKLPQQRERIYMDGLGKV